MHVETGSNPNTVTDLKDTDRCVMCGLCLPHCPTYLYTQDEAESPRGRISLMQALASGRLEPTPRLIGHLDHCLNCRACEKACPSRVPYGRLIDHALAHIETGRQRSWRSRLLRGLALRQLLPKPGRLRGLAWLLWLYQRSGLRFLMRHTGLLRLTGTAALEDRLPPVPLPGRLPAYTPPLGPSRGDVGLLIGCVAGPLDQATHLAAIDVLSRFGYGVHVPRQQACCGALHRHLGETRDADDLLKHTCATFSGFALEALVTTSSACGGYLAEHGADLPPVRDIHEFLDGRDWPEGLVLHAMPETVVVHEPCSHRNGPQPVSAVYRLLQRIPGLEIVPLPGNSRCCGGAGSHMLTQPALANRLRDEKLAGLAGMQTRTLVTSNIGCALHLAAGLREDGKRVEVMHPVQLLARQLPAEISAKRRLG